MKVRKHLHVGPGWPVWPLKRTRLRLFCLSGPTATMADHIATAAYYPAQARGFAPGRELQDWLEAEAELLKHDAG